MNPPFVPITDLEADPRHDVAEILGDMNTGRVDIAMAFVLKAIQSLRPGGALGCVLPGSVLYGDSGFKWRERLQQDTDIVIMGRFEGYRYFPTSMVETCFLVLRRKGERTPRPTTVQVVIAEEGTEDAALRALRLPDDDQRRSTEGVEVFAIDPRETTAESWRPQRRSVYQYRRQLQSRGLPRIDSLFQIRQGIMTGDNDAFIISAEDFSRLGGKERLYFRPAAGSKTIRRGQLLPSEYVFYPYGDQGLLLTTEEEVKQQVRQFFTKWLKPRQPTLETRSKITHWWGISRLCVWQFHRMPRIVSAFFGGSGSFAFDVNGDYAVVSGYGWDWRTSLPNEIDFAQTQLPWAYLGLLNSTVFERILSWFSVPLQGGQMRLEPRFLSRIPIPDLSAPDTPPDLIEDLVLLGRAVHRGKLEDVRERLDKAAASAWGLPQQMG
jgi:hypothetical protein